MNISWNDFKQKLYKIVISTNDLLLQFDTQMNIRRIKNNPIREKFYSLFFEYLKGLQTPLER